MPLSSIDFISPPDVVATATAFFGGEIALDPASSNAANEVVGANKYFTPEKNGLIQTWKAKSIYLYPPRDFLLAFEQPKNTNLFSKPKYFQKSAQRVWLEECLKRYKKGEFEEGLIFLTSAEVALLVTQKLKIDLPLCILKEHPKLYIDQVGHPKVKNTRCLGFVLYVPSYLNTEKRITEFSDLFNTVGRVYYQ
jgi:hypothetical protein